MAYSETRIVIGGLAHVPVLIFIAQRKSQVGFMISRKTNYANL